MHRVPLNRRTFTTVAALAATSVVASELRAQSRSLKIKVSIAVGGKASLYCLPLTIAEQLGYFRAEGLEVEITDFAGDAQALEALAGGSVDVVSGAFENTIKHNAKEQRLQAFVLQGRAPGIAMGVSPKTMPSYKSVLDLKGKRVGVLAPDSSTHMLVRLMLARAGLKTGDVSIIGVGTGGDAVKAWRSGQLDAISHFEPVMTVLEQKSEIRIIADTRTLNGTEDVFGGPMPGGCLFAPLEFIKKAPDTVQALTNAMVHSLKWLQTAGPSDIIKTVPEAYLVGDRALYLSAFNKVRDTISPDGMITDEGTRHAAQVLASLAPTIKGGATKLSESYTNEFSKPAKARFRA